MRTETSNRKDTRDKEHDPIDWIAKQVYRISDRIIETTRKIQGTFSHNITAIFWHKKGWKWRE